VAGDSEDAAVQGSEGVDFGGPWFGAGGGRGGRRIVGALGGLGGVMGGLVAQEMGDGVVGRGRGGGGEERGFT
jgi:hypothetical protein